MSALTRTRSRLGVAALGFAALLTLATACTAQDAVQENSPSDSSSASSSDAPEKDFLDWQLKFAECMRGEGIDMPDPSSDGMVSVTQPDDQEAFDAAVTLCQDQLGAPPAADNRSDQEILDEQLKTAKCLRDAGYEVDDPQTGEAFGIPSEATDEDLEACGIQW